MMKSLITEPYLHVHSHQELRILPNQFFNRVKHPGSLINVIKLLSQALHPFQMLLLLHCRLSLGNVIRKGVPEVQMFKLKAKEFFSPCDQSLDQTACSCGFQPGGRSKNRLHRTSSSAAHYLDLKIFKEFNITVTDHLTAF